MSEAKLKNGQYWEVAIWNNSGKEEEFLSKVIGTKSFPKSRFYKILT